MVVWTQTGKDEALPLQRLRPKRPLDGVSSTSRALDYRVQGTLRVRHLV